MIATLHIRKRPDCYDREQRRIHLPADHDLSTRCGLDLDPETWVRSEDLQPGDVLCMWCEEADKRDIDQLTPAQKSGIASGWRRRMDRAEGERQRLEAWNKAAREG